MPEAVPQRAGEIVEEALARASGRRAGRARIAARARRAAPAAPTAAARRRRCRSGRRARARRCRGSEALGNARQLEWVRAIRARAPRRRAAASGRACPGSRGPPGRTRCAAASSPSRSASLNISGIAHALSVPTPCSPVIEPPASTHASRIWLASSSARVGLAFDPRRRRARADAGCRRRHGRRCRRAARARCESSSIRRSTSRRARARDDAVLHVVVRADAAHRGERRLPSAPDRRPVGRVGGDADLDAPRLRRQSCLDCARGPPRPARCGPSSSMIRIAPQPGG